MITTDKTQENRVRGLAARQGFQVKRSRQRFLSLNNHGEFMLVRNGWIVLGERFDASLEAIEAFLREEG
jgi:hypothetical protein